MRTRTSSFSDSTASTAVGDVSGQTVLEEILTRLSDEQERVIVFAYAGLGFPLTALAAGFGVTHQEVKERYAVILTGLREDTELLSRLSGIRHAGRAEHYQALIQRIGLQHWFCQQCGNFMVQSGVGRPRKTCSDRCRHLNWKEKRRKAAEKERLEV